MKRPSVILIFATWNLLDLFFTLLFFHAELNPLVLSAGKDLFIFIKIWSSIILFWGAYYVN